VRRRRAGLAAAAAVALGAAAGIPLAAGAGTTGETDLAGDAGAGFDITALTVANDDAGAITFRVALPALTAVPDNMALAILLDTDLVSEANPVDFLIVLIRNGAAIVPVTPAGNGAPFIPRSLSTSFAPGVVTASVARGDVGDPLLLIASAASFVLAPDGTPDTAANTDIAPADGALVHLVKLPTRLLVRSASLSSARPAAGGPFRAGVFVRDVTYGVPGDPARRGRVTCKFTVGGEKVTAARSLTRAGRATCAGTVPRDAAGQTLRGTVTFTLNRAVVTRSFTATVAG
jgi:hypothetical protein